MLRPSALLLMATAACGTRPNAGAASQSIRDSADAAFAGVQSRGHQAMGVDQYTSTHRFEPLPNGGRIVLQRDRVDSAGTAQIRRHMARIAEAFGRGNFALPGFVHAREVPGTAVMAERRSRITYTVDTMPRGGQLRIQSDDPAAIAAIHQFLAFQRQDHRASAGGTAQ
jgi:hypothetical protein